jgi:hypothetical protein
VTNLSIIKSKELNSALCRGLVWNVLSRTRIHGSVIILALRGTIYRCIYTYVFQNTSLASVHMSGINTIICWLRLLGFVPHRWGRFPFHNFICALRLSVHMIKILYYDIAGQRFGKHISRATNTLIEIKALPLDWHTFRSNGQDAVIDELFEMVIYIRFAPRS